MNYYEPFIGGGAVFFHLRGTEPYIKWVGSKRQLISQLAPHLPDFPAGGPARAFLSDDNLRLVRTYRALQADVDSVISLLREYKRQYERAPRETYMRARELSRVSASGQSTIDQRDDAAVGAWLIFVNKNSFNGLYRVNQKNELNADWGKYENPAICDEDRLRRCAAALRGADIRHADFEQALAGASTGDFAYLDPPYAPVSKTASFTCYTPEGAKSAGMVAFQTRVRDAALALKRRGVRVLVSNSGAPLVRQLYGDQFEMVEVQARRMVNRDGSKRGKVGELLMK
jgi:DNA adenine methylase